MKKWVIVFGFIICSISCKEKEPKNEILNGHYFDITSSTIYNFDNSSLTKYDVYDSLSVSSKYHIENNIIEIQNKKCPFEISNDTLIIFNYLEGKDKLILKKILLKEFNIKSIDSTSWSRNIQRTSRETNAKYNEEQIIKLKLKSGLDAYYIINKNKDTLFGAHFDYEGKIFNKFALFKLEFITLIITNCDNQKLEMLLSYGDLTDIEKFNRLNE